MVGPFFLSLLLLHQVTRNKTRVTGQALEEKRHAVWMERLGWVCIDAFSGSKANTDETQSRRHPWLQKPLAIDVSGLGFQS